MEKGYPDATVETITKDKRRQYDGCHLLHCGGFPDEGAGDTLFREFLRFDRKTLKGLLSTKGTEISFIRNIPGDETSGRHPEDRKLLLGKRVYRCEGMNVTRISPGIDGGEKSPHPHLLYF
jgi:hypothetical protein